MDAVARWDMQGYVVFSLPNGRSIRVSGGFARFAVVNGQFECDALDLVWALDHVFEATLKHRLGRRKWLESTASYTQKVMTNPPGWVTDVRDLIRVASLEYSDTGG